MIQRILVPIDFSPPSQDALDYAVELGKLTGAELTALHVVETIQYAMPADLFGAAANLGMLEEEQRRVAERELARVTARLERRGIKVRGRLATGSPAQTIADAAKRLKASLIIMATHGRTGLTHLLMGSVAERVVRTATCPVLTLRPKARSRSAGKKRAATPKIRKSAKSAKTTKSRKQ